MVKKAKKPGAADFEENDLVAVKIKGYPTWPGRIESIKWQPRKKYVIRFFGTNDIGVSYTSIKPFCQMTAAERKCSQKAFVEAMRQCQEEERRRGGPPSNFSTNNQIKKQKTKTNGTSNKADPKTSESDADEDREDDKEAADDKEAVDQETEAVDQEKEAVDQEKEAVDQEKEAVDQEKEASEHEKAVADQKKEAADQEKAVADQKKEDEANDNMIEEHKADANDALPTPAVQSEQTITAQPQSPEKLSFGNNERPRRNKAKRKIADLEEEETSAKRDLDNATKEPVQPKEATIIEKAEENNNTENRGHDDADDVSPEVKNDYLPDLSSPDDDNEDQSSKVESKNEDLTSRHCSLNDLTSEQANADRGNKPPSKRATNIRATDRELTIAKLKKKLQAKLLEKDEKKRAFRDQKSFEKALKGLPAFERKLSPLSKSIARFIDRPNNMTVSNQVIASMHNCETCLTNLAKCLKLMTSEYGQQRRECFQFHSSLSEIVTNLKYIKSIKTYAIRKDCSKFLKTLKGKDEIKGFINGMTFPLYNDSVVERKENSRANKRKSALRSEQLMARISAPS